MNTYQAKRIPLRDIFAALGHEPSEPHVNAHGELLYSSPFRQETEPSFSLNVERNVWYDFGLGAGGNIIDFGLKYFQVSTVAAVLHELEALMGGQKNPPALAPAKPKSPPKEPEESFTLVKIAPLQNKALIKYLNTRGIDAATAEPYVQEMYYTRHEKRYFSLAFPNVSGGYELRNAYFKGVHKKKDISVIEGVSTAGVMVFEGFIDFLSALAWHKVTSPPLAVIVLNSVTLRDKALAAIRDKGVQTVHLYLDHDPAGRELTAFLQQQLAGVEVVDQSAHYGGHKDFNAFLVSQRQLEKLG
jgi:Toprim-like/CHC2 zinc finger